MKPDLFIRQPAGCDAFQAQLSDLADSGGAPTPGLLAHLDGCAACAGFAEAWLAGPPAPLARSVPDLSSDGHLRERILDAAMPTKVVEFPATAASGFSWSTWLNRIAACLAVAGFSYWLLNPVRSPINSRIAATPAPTLAQGLAQLESHSQREQRVLQTALVDGGRQVRGNVVWSVSALEL